MPNFSCPNHLQNTFTSTSCSLPSFQMLFSKKELTSWLGISIFEMWLAVNCLLVFSLFLALKLEGAIDWSWWTVFVPLFTFDACAAYFVAIVCIRLILDKDRRIAVSRTIWNASNLMLLLVYKVLLCERLERRNNLTYSLIHVPVFIFFLMLTVRGCHVVS